MFRALLSIIVPAEIPQHAWYAALACWRFMWMGTHLPMFPSKNHQRSSSPKWSFEKNWKNNSLEPIAKARDKSSEPEKKVVSQPTYSTKNTEMDPLEKNQKANKSTSKIIGNKLFFQKNSSVSSYWCHTMILFWVLGMCSLKLTL